MHKALYRKWRPQTFDDVCGQETVTDILKYEVANGKTTHAYLFCGSRGTGKTTCAKLMAKAVNCLSPKDGNPCNECAACRSIDAGTATDVVEMDAASNTSVDNVRDIKDEIVFLPAELRYRVYIIDEVHMLSTSAFNALLKTLEEPPAHVVFILATTEIQKLPSTIVSRCQRFDFRRIRTDVIMERLLYIAGQEGIKLTSDAARQIARMAQGGMRDAISLFELCAGQNQNVDLASVTETLGVGSRENDTEVIRAIAAKDYDTIYRRVADTVMGSSDLSVFFQGLIDYYRDMMVYKTTKDAKAYLDLTESEDKEVRETAALFSMPTLVYHAKCLEEAAYSMLRTNFSKRSTAEIALTRMCDPNLSTTTDALLQRIDRLESEINALRSGANFSVRSEEQPKVTVREGKPEQPEAIKVPGKKETTETTETIEKPVYKALPRFHDVIEQVGKVRSSVVGFLERAKAYVTPDNEILLRVNSKLGANILKREETIAVLRGALLSEFGDTYKDSPFIIESPDEKRVGDFIEELENALGTQE